MLGGSICTEDDSIVVWRGLYSHFFLLRMWVANKLGLHYTSLTVIDGTFAREVNTKVAAGTITPTTKIFFYHSDNSGEWSVCDLSLITDMLEPLVANSSFIKSRKKLFADFKRHVFHDVNSMNERTQTWAGKLNGSRYMEVVVRCMYDYMLEAIAANKKVVFIA